MVFKSLGEMLRVRFLELAHVRYSPPLHRRKRSRFGAELQSLESRVLLTNTAPTFDQPAYQFEVASGSSLIGGINVTDADGDALLLATDNTDFTVSPEGDVYFSGIAAAGSSHTVNITASDGLATASVPLTVTFTGNPSYDETQQLAEDLIDEEYFEAQDQYNQTVNEYTYTSDYYYSQPDYNSALGNSPLGDITGGFGDQINTADDYQQQAEQTQQDANTQQQTTTTTTNTGGSGTTEEEEEAAPEIDPRLQWTAFSFTNDIEFPEGSLPAEALLDNLFALTPTETANFSTTTVLTGAPVLATTSEDGLTTEKQTDTHTTITLSQEWISATEWVVTQSITRFFTSEESGEHADGPTDSIGRTGSSTLTITVINGLKTIVSYTIEDSFSYSKSHSWDRPPATEEGDGTTEGLLTDSEEEDTPAAEDVDRGSFNSSFQSSSSLSVTLETTLITLPDGRSAKVYTFGYSTSSTFTSSVDASAELNQSEGTIKGIRVKEDEEQTEEDTPVEPNAPTTDNETTETDPPGETESELEIEEGGNGSSIGFTGNFNFASNFASNFGLNLSATVAEDESLADAVVTGNGSFGLASGFTQGGGSSLDIQLQTSSVSSTGDGAHEYIIFASISNNADSRSHSLGIDFDIDTAVDQIPEAVETTDTDPTTVPPPDARFTFNTDQITGGRSFLLYSQKTPSGTPENSFTTTEELAAKGSLAVVLTYDFTLADGVFASIDTTGEGMLKYKLASISEHEPPFSFSQPTTGSWHYPQFLHELTVTNTGNFNSSVGMTFNLTDGLNRVVRYTGEYTTESRQLDMTEWLYWETLGNGVNNYMETGYGAGITNTTFKYTGNWDDGVDTTFAQTHTSDSDVTSVGTKQSGGATTQNGRIAVSTDGNHWTIHLEVQDFYGRQGPFHFTFGFYGDRVSKLNPRGFFMGAPGEVRVLGNPSGVSSFPTKGIVLAERELSPEAIDYLLAQIDEQSNGTLRYDLAAGSYSHVLPGTGDYRRYHFTSCCRDFADDVYWGAAAQDDVFIWAGKSYQDNDALRTLIEGPVGKLNWDILDKLRLLDCVQQPFGTE